MGRCLGEDEAAEDRRARKTGSREETSASEWRRCGVGRVSEERLGERARLVGACGVPAAGWAAVWGEGGAGDPMADGRLEAEDG